MIANAHAEQAEPEDEPDEDEEEEEDSSEDESEDSEEDDAGGEAAAEEESVTVRPSAPPSSVQPPSVPPPGLPSPFAHRSQQSGEFIMPTPSASLAGRVVAGIPVYSPTSLNEHHQSVARDRYVAEIRKRYNDMVVAQAVAASQMDALRLAEERATGMTFGLYHYSTFDPCQQEVVSSGDLSSVSRR